MDNKEDIKKAETEEKRISPFWNKQVVIFLVLPILLTVLVPLGGFPYLCGRLNYHLSLICIFYPLVLGFIIYCLVRSIGIFFRDWRQIHVKKKLVIVSQIGVPIVFFALFIIPFFLPIESGLHPPAQLFNYGFRDRIRSKADIKVIRDWMRTLSEEEYSNFSVRLPRDKWPKSLKVLNPNGITLLADKNANPQVRMMWGAAIFHWEVAIGMEDMVITTSEINEWTECWLLVEPGVYVYNW